MSSSSSKTPHPSPSARAAARARMKKLAAAAVAAKQLETATDSKGDIGDTRPTNIVNSAASNSKYSLATPKTDPENLSKVPIGVHPLDASSTEYSRESARSPHPFSHSSTMYTSPSSPIQPYQIPSQMVQGNGPHDNMDRPFLSPAQNYRKYSRVGLKLYREKEDEDSIKREDEEIDALSTDDGELDTPYMPGSEADNRRYCLSWLRNVPKPGSSQLETQSPKRK
ncbi:hypothetical protein M413DRAFT_12080 [Hebeloma cylindrosporum]|uniref:Uncharacterized protein n=1 Tax=Hebeloma cylindrosporum TaxID=76867 RepID=A0A0C2XPA5_HEBCY|nr:hypothetical protein M413DRAFT_12080 [Hebeloma cylindrosporum h7]